MGSGNSRRGGNGPAASAGVISTDPGLADTPFHGLGTPPPPPPLPLSLAGDDTLKGVPEGQSEGSTFLIAGGESEGRGEGERAGEGAGEGRGGQLPGTVPLDQRPHKHRKYYKVRFSDLGGLGACHPPEPNPTQPNLTQPKSSNLVASFLPSLSWECLSTCSSLL